MSRQGAVLLTGATGFVGTETRDALTERVTDIVHSAASVSFALPLDRSRHINVAGTEEILRLADLCRRRGGLDRLGYISTAYARGSTAAACSSRTSRCGSDMRTSRHDERSSRSA